jgi:YHS domain-containing protein
MFVTIVLAALAVDGLFSAAGIIPTARPTRDDIFGSVEVDYKLFLNVIGTFVFVALMYLTFRNGARDPVCGMHVDRRKALSIEHADQTVYFCSERCRTEFGVRH